MKVQCPGRFRHAVVLIVFLVPLVSTSCRFCPNVVCNNLDDKGPIAAPTTSPPPIVVLEQSGTLIVFRGSACAKSEKSGKEDLLKLQHTLELPPYATQATVFLNGWNLTYLSKDHHVAGLGTLIGKISVERNTLKWQAAGILSDDNFDDAYSWCYYYTVIAWNPTQIDLRVDQKDGGCGSGDSNAPLETNFFDYPNDGAGETTSLVSVSSFLQNADFESPRNVAILPRGFGFRWGCAVDHHLGQIAYNLDHSDVFVDNRKYRKQSEDVVLPLPNRTSRAGSGFVSWQSYGIFKDNSTRRGYSFSELVSGLAGSELSLIQPPFSVLPTDDGDCLPGSRANDSEHVVENVPFEFAIPMLTGWDLGFGAPNGGCEDQHITDVGIWIDVWSYTKLPGASTGTLSYKLTTRFRDKDGFPGPYFRHKVTILGLRPTTVPVPKDQIADLVPTSPLGGNAPPFCRLEAGDKLRVTVTNQGAQNAGPSKTTVAFSEVDVTLDTPPIPAGGSTDLLFQIPRGCFNPNCSFRIIVDSSHQVNEGANEGNNTASGTCRG
jgi:CARDB